MQLLTGHRCTHRVDLLHGTQLAGGVPSAAGVPEGFVQGSVNALRISEVALAEQEVYLGLGAESAVPEAAQIPV